MTPEQKELYEDVKARVGGHGWDLWMHTGSGDEIKPGLMVFTYDWIWAMIEEERYWRQLEKVKYALDRCWELSSNDFWFEVKTHIGRGNIFNGERMTCRCPNCHGTWESCNESYCGQRKFEKNWTGFKLAKDGRTVVHRDTVE